MPALPAGIGHSMSSYTAAVRIERGRRIRLWLLLAVLVVAWSLNYIFGKFAIAAAHAVSPQPARAVLIARVLTSAAIFLLLYLGRRPQQKTQLTRGDWLRLMALGLAGVTGNQLGFVIGLGHTSVAHAALFNALTPIFVLIIAVTIGQERLTAAKLAGLALCFAGTALLFWKAIGGTATRAGDLIVIFGATSFAIFTVGSKSTVARYGTLFFNCAIFCLGGIFLLPFCWSALLQTDWLRLSAAGWVGIMYMALIGSVAAYLIYYEAMRSISASQVAVLSYLQPFLATLAGAWLLPNEPLTPTLALVGAIIMLGVWLTESGSGRSAGRAGEV